MGISQFRLAKDIGVPAMRISKVGLGERGIIADTALRLTRYSDMSVEFWTGIQTHYEVERAKMELAGRLEEEVKYLHLCNRFIKEFDISLRRGTEVGVSRSDQLSIRSMSGLLGTLAIGGSSPNHDILYSINAFKICILRPQDGIICARGCQYDAVSHGNLEFG